MGTVVDYLKNNFGTLLKSLLLIVGAFLILKNLNKIITWIKQQFTNINPNDTPDSNDLKDPNYVIHSKIISNYVQDIIASIDQMGTDEKRLDRIYQALKNTSKANTVAVWNEFLNYQITNKLKYERTTGTFMRFLGDKVSNLYEVLENELKDNQSEKNALTNWRWLLHTKAGLI